MMMGKTTDGVQQYDLDSWRDFFSLTKEVFASGPAYVYRGQANWDWPIVSSLDRLEKEYPQRKNLSGHVPAFFDWPPLSEEEQLTAFKRASRGRRGPNPPDLDEDGWWALGQHHGLATPLVDWTRSPFMALFFAFEEERVRTDDGYVVPEHRALCALSTCAYGDADSGSPQELTFVSPMGDDNYRLVSQASLLLRVPRHRDVETCIKKKCAGEQNGAFLIKFRIPNDGRDECLIVLSKMGINHMTLFPDIGGAARHVNSLWQPGHEDSLPYV